MSLGRIATTKGHVVPTLNHSSATTLPDQSFDCYSYLGAFGRCLLGMQCRKHASPACAEDQDISILAFNIAFEGHVYIAFKKKVTEMRKDTARAAAARVF